MTTRRAAVLIAMALSLLVAMVASSPVGAQDDDPPDLGAPVVGVSTVVADPNEIPAITFLQATIPGADPAGCTGTLVAPQWVLTAAHCVMLADGTIATSIIVLVGTIDAQADFNSPSPGVETHASDGWVIHGDASISPRWWNDLAMVHLPSPSAITPMALATDTSLTEPASNNAADRLDARFYGFGLHQFEFNNREPQDFKLRRGESTIYSDGFVENTFNPPLGGFLNTKEINRNIFMFPDLDTQGGGCFGDSGGPMLVMQEGNYRLAGVNSFISSPVQDFCDPFVGFPGISQDFIMHAVADLVGTNLGSWVTSIFSATGTCAGQTVEIMGSGQGDILVGTGAADVMSGRGGDDLMLGRGGADTLCGGSGNDVLRGGGGPDVLRGNGGGDDIAGQKGHDNIRGNAGADFISGGSGADTIKGDRGNDDILGNGGTDTIRSGSGGDRVRGGGKADTIAGGRGADDLGGGKGADIINGGAHDDIINGNGGPDTLNGNGGDDTIDGGGGIDTCAGGSGQNTVANC